MRFIAGVASAWVFVGTATLVLARLAALGTRRFDGMVFAGVGTGIALAGLVCYGGAWLGFDALALWLALAALALAGTWLALAGETSAVAAGGAQASAPASRGSEGSLGSARRLVLCYGLFGFGYILPATYLPSQARLLLGDPALFGWVWPVFGIAAALSTLGIALLGHWPRKRAWACAQGVMAVGVLLPAVMSGLTGLALAALCVGGTFMVITLLGMQQAREQAGDHAQKQLAAMTAAFAAGQLAGPMVANVLLALGWMLDAALWLGAAALLASSALLVFSPSTPTIDQEHS
jgi:predicted MFS family arabinose efflux permease